jgi:hypothetical protein
MAGRPVAQHAGQSCRYAVDTYGSNAIARSAAEQHALRSKARHQDLSLRQPSRAWLKRNKRTLDVRFNAPARLSGIGVDELA